MSFTETEIITVARARVGNLPDIDVSERYAPDNAIRAEIKENILECARIYGASSSKKEVEWTGVRNPQIQPPEPLTLSLVSGSLFAATYGYIITATQGLNETNAGTPATIVNPGSMNNVVSWSGVAGATGYKVYGRFPGSEQLLAVITNPNTLTWTDNGTAVPGSGLPIKNSTGRWMQEFPVSTFIGSDVYEVVELLRSDFGMQHDSSLYMGGGCGEFGLLSQLAPNPPFINQGLQEPAFEQAQAVNRSIEKDKFSYELFSSAGQTYLRVYPEPHRAVLFHCTYLSIANGVSSLPDNARVALENAACRAIFDCIINRTKSEPMGVGQESELARRAFMEVVVNQRDYYAFRYQRSIMTGRGGA